MLIDKVALRKFVEENPKLVTRRQSKRHPNLYVLKYTRKVFYDALWETDEMLLYCRGLVVDADYNVVIKPFTKVFNFGENGTTIDDEEVCSVVTKINGFLGVATYNPDYSDKLIISTTGSLDSDFVDLAYNHIQPFENSIISAIGDKKATFMFEICDKTDPHIIREKEGAWLIGVNGYEANGESYPVPEFGLDMLAQTIGLMRPVRYDFMKFKEVKELMKTCRHEGYMVYGLSSGVALKYKSPYYLLTKFLARMTDTKFDTLVKTNNRREAFKRFDEEFYPLIDNIFECPEDWISKDEQLRIRCIEKYFGM